MTAADRLRQAAEVLRERAEAHQRAQDAQSIGDMLSSHDALNEVGFQSSSVALAVADWLDAENEVNSALEWHDRRFGTESFPAATSAPALAVAHLILGEAS